MEAREKFNPDRICHYPHMKFVASVMVCGSKMFLRLFQDILCTTLVWLERKIDALFPPPGFQTGWERGRGGANVQVH